MFQLTAQEWNNLKSQFVISSFQPAEAEGVGSLRSQLVTLNRGGPDAANRSQIVTGSHGGRRKLPFAFTEHGAMMAAMVLNSPETVAMSLFVIRAFIRMREQFAANAAILKRLAEIDKTLLEHDQVPGLIWEQLQPLLTPPPDPPRRRIGFHQDFCS